MVYYLTYVAIMVWYRSFAYLIFTFYNIYEKWSIIWEDINIHGCYRGFNYSIIQDLTDCAQDNVRGINICLQTWLCAGAQCILAVGSLYIKVMFTLWQSCGWAFTLEGLPYWFQICMAITPQMHMYLFWAWLFQAMITFTAQAALSSFLSLNHAMLPGATWSAINNE